MYNHINIQLATSTFPPLICSPPPPPLLPPSLPPLLPPSSLAPLFPPPLLPPSSSPPSLLSSLPPLLPPSSSPPSLLLYSLLLSFLLPLTDSLSLSMIASSSSKCLSFISNFFIWVSTSNATSDLIFRSSTFARCYQETCVVCVCVWGGGGGG